MVFTDYNKGQSFSYCLKKNPCYGKSVGVRILLSQPYPTIVTMTATALEITFAVNKATNTLTQNLRTTFFSMQVII